jgi:outer membrane protein OmpA-like peptidoglycan-associated protein
LQTFFNKERRKKMRQATWVIIIALVIGFSLMPVASYAKNSYFGVSNKALGYPQEFDETEAAINKAEQSPGAKFCPEKLAQAKELAKKGVEAYWACLTKEGLAMLAQARQWAKEAELCKPVAPKPVAPKPVAPKPVAPTTVTLTGDFAFALNSAELTSEGRAILDEFIPALKANPNTKIVIAGHTCNLGNAVYNQRLSERRAQAAADYLISRGIAAERLTIFGYGEIRPALSNDTEQGRAKNRRVELTIK